MMSLPDEVDKRDDDMEPEMYEHPPGLMPDVDHDYDYIWHGTWYRIYDTNDVNEEMIKSTVFVPIEP